jgi:hypothetical protein
MTLENFRGYSEILSEKSPELHILKPSFLDVFLHKSPGTVHIGGTKFARSPGHRHQGSMEVPKDVPVREAYCVFSR